MPSDPPAQPSGSPVDLSPEGRERLTQQAWALIRERSDPPLCRVCSDPLVFARSGHEGTLYVCERGYGRGYDRARMEHHDRSQHWNPKPCAMSVAVAYGLLAVLEALSAPAGEGQEPPHE